MADLILEASVIAARLDWTVDETAVWLEKEGLGKFVTHFEEHNVDGAALVTADVGTIRDVWKIEPGQDRRDMIDAIERLKLEASNCIRHERGEKVEDAPKTAQEGPSLGHGLNHKQAMAAVYQSNKDSSPLPALKKEQDWLQQMDKKSERLAASGRAFVRPQKTQQLLGNVIPAGCKPDTEGTVVVAEQAPTKDSPFKAKSQKEWLDILEEQQRDKAEKAEGARAYAQEMEKLKP